MELNMVTKDKVDLLPTKEEVEEHFEKGELEKITKITMPKDQAKIEWKKYCKFLEERKEKFLKVMKDSMYHFKEGRNLIDVYEAMENAGLNEKFQPKLAISRADYREVMFEKKDQGTGSFGKVSKYSSTQVWDPDGVNLPQNIFKTHWPRETDQNGVESRWTIDKRSFKTKVPIIPIELIPDGDLSNYYVLWEVKEWEDLPEAKKDPFLLKRISENLFVVLGAWEVTDLERAIIRGLK